MSNIYTIIQHHHEHDETFYLNHSCLSTKSFGSEDMAWTTEDYEKAELMLESVEHKHKGSNSSFKVIQLY